ncbi:hypothetical protein [Caulobacter sp. FWC2]|uniref:hypothetical protein n=1 Tax=Caulobacter sp. FWC2 TaxID=69664 RepID=UPI000C15E0BB|nr:hypothetical protein [Caulobacter sp. FWC2]PIB89930.1 hypothetical protein CSW62_25140 [Caulobacter sp. FWC2]
MATPLEALFAASLGLLGGLVGSATLERLKAGVASLDIELVRLESFEDDLFDVFALAADHADRSAMLRQLNGRRRRLGLNLKRKIADSTAYQACKAELVKLDGFLAKAEDAVALDDELEGSIEASIRRLRNQVKHSSRTARAFSLLRGDG